MNVPNIPADNYYKFLALSGVSIVIACILFSATEWSSLDSEVSKIETETTELSIEIGFLEEDADLTNAKIARLGHVDPALLNKNLDSLTTAHFIQSTSDLMKDRNLREFYEFVFRYDDELFPEKLKINKISEEFSLQKEL